MDEDYHSQARTPILDVVRIVSLKDNQVLLVQEVDDPNWKLPGGKIHAGETIFEAFQRELLEELGSEFQEEVILNYKSATIPESENIRHIFLVQPVEESEIKKTIEVAQARYFDLADLPDTKFKNHILSAVSLVSG